MKLLLISAFFWASVFASDVLEFTTSNFNDQVADTNIILVEFYAPWCGHCKKLAPEYEKAATKLKNNDPPIPIAKVDCVADESKDICSRFGVSGYPTLKIFRNGDTANPEDYQGPRKANGIVNFMKARSGPASKELKEVTEFEDFKTKSDDTMVVGLFSSDSSPLAKEFIKAAGVLRENFIFAHSYNSDVVKAAGDFTDEIVIIRPKHLHSKLEDNQVAIGDVNAKNADIQKFIKAKFAGLAGHVTPDNAAFFPKPLCVAYYQVDYEKNIKGTNYFRNRVAKVAQKFGEKMSFAVGSKEDFGGILSEMNINTNSEDVNVVCWNAASEKYRMDPDTKFSMETLEAFVQEYLDDKLEPYLKSEDIPSDNSGPVKVVVAKNFDAIVNDPDRDVLIEFYAPWCGHCKSLEPKYKELGEKLAGKDSVVIAKMDATANDVPQPYNVRGFPTIYWSPKGSKSNPKKYEGGREVKDFLDFIKKEASDKNLKDEL